MILVWLVLGLAAWLALNGAVFLFLLHRSNGAQRKPRS